MKKVIVIFAIGILSLSACEVSEKTNPEEVPQYRIAYNDYSKVYRVETKAPGRKQWEEIDGGYFEFDNNGTPKFFYQTYKTRRSAEKRVEGFKIADQMGLKRLENMRKRNSWRVAE